MNIRKLFVGVSGIAAAASLIGLGAGASFSESAHASQKVTVGTIDIRLSVSQDGPWVKGPLNLPDVGPVDSLGKVVHQTVFVENIGSLKEYITSAKVTTTDDTLTTNMSVLPINGPLNPNEPNMTIITYTVPASLGNSTEGQSATVTLTIQGSDQPGI